MALNAQLQSFFFCFTYGLFFSLIYNLNYKYIYKIKTIFKLIISFIFVTDNVLLFYIILVKINYGIIHPYFLLMLLFGFLLGNVWTKKIRIN
jgi:hypothetical protein